MRHLAFCTIGLAALASAGQAATLDALVFGDSLSDPFVAGLATEARQYTNGDTWAVQIGATSPAAGNFAQAGAVALSDGDDATDQDFDGQIATFAMSDLRSDGDRVAYVWFGGNDAAAAVERAAPLAATGAPDAAIAAALSARIGPAVTDMGDGLVRLIDSGVDQIVVFTAPDIGLTPLLSGLGLSALGTQASALFNAGLRDIVAGLPRTASVGLVDSDAVIAPALADPAAYGLTNLTDPCILDAEIQSGAGCDGYAFFDPFHPGETIHGLFADAAREAVTDPAPVPLPGTAPLLLLALGGAAAIRRRTA